MQHASSSPTHKIPLLLRTLSQINPLHNLSPIFVYVHFNINMQPTNKQIIKHYKIDQIKHTQF